MRNLIDQVKSFSEDFTLNLNDEVNKILQHFNVTIVGTQDKRKQKRTRLVKHFQRQFYKFMRMEKEWIYPTDKGKKENALGLTEKEKYEMSLARKEKALIKELQ